MDTGRDALADKLASADAAVRAAAALEMGAARSADRLGLLLERLNTESEPEVVAAFLRAIGQLGSPRELSLLAQYIDHTDARVRATVIEALFGLNTPVALPLIVPFLSDPDQRVRTMAALVLQKLGPDRSLHVLQQMLGSPHVWMRASAATALGLFDAAVAVPLLEKCLQDPNAKVQDRATLALRRFSRKQLKSVTGISKAAVRKVLKATSQPNLRKLTRKVATLGPAVPPRGAGVAAAASLGLGTHEAAPSASPVASSGTPSASGEAAARGSPAPVTEAAGRTLLAGAPRDEGLSRIEAVIAARDGTALGRLVEELTGDEDRFVTARLLSAIGLLGEQSFVPVLLAHLGHPDARVASNAVWALTRLRHAAARDQVLPLLRSMQPRLRANAILFFADDASADVRGPLEEMIRSADVQTRLSGLFCLAELDQPELLPLADLIAWQPDDAALRATVRARLTEMEKRGIGLARRVREIVENRPVAAPKPPEPGAHIPAARSAGIPPQKVPASTPVQKGPARGPALKAQASGPARTATAENRLSPDGKAYAQSDNPTGTLVPISRRRWKTFLLVARALATATDAAVIGVPLLCGLFVLESLAGGLPPVLPPAALAAGLLLFVLRDMPSGPGVGKRLLGLSVVGAPGSGIAPRLLRQAPVLLLPWGIAELWAATRDGRGQRPIDVKHGIEVVPRGAPLLVHFTAVWLVLCATLAGTYVFVTSRPVPTDGLLWSLKTGFRPQGTVEPAFIASVEPPASSSDPGDAARPVVPVAVDPGRWNHPTLGISIPVPRDWRISACGSAWLELRPGPGSSITTGAITMAMPEELETAPEVTAWGEELARRFNQGLEREGLRLTFWTPPAGTSSVAGTDGRLYRGDLLGGQEATLFTCGRLVRPLGVICRTGGEPGASRRLIETMIRDCRALPAGGDWRAYRSPFQPLDLKVPRGWTVAREDRAGLELRHGIYADAGWIRLEPAPASQPRERPEERIAARYRKAWEQHGFEVVRTTPIALKGASRSPGLMLDLRARGVANARFRLAWIDGPVPCWAAEWLEREAVQEAPALEEVIAGLRRS